MDHTHFLYSCGNEREIRGYFSSGATRLAQVNPQNGITVGVWCRVSASATDGSVSLFREAGNSQRYVTYTVMEM